MSRGQNSRLTRIRYWIIRLVLGITALWLSGLVIFAFVPVLFSAVMVERQLGAWFSGDFSYVAHSDWVDMPDISPWMALAVIASEDQKFPTHWGFDVAAIQSVLDSDGEKKAMRGASTLSQQTAKNVFLWDGRSWLRKGLEAGLTVGIESVWTKRRILTVYLNVAEMGKGVFGVEEASQRYFHKPASRLTRSEAALLAALLPDPLHFRANAPSAYLRQRQQWILRQMRQLGGENFLLEHKLR
ncbi:monofunctional biosynthetic peptidoglycan transglycosylase [Erwinia pyrifoliae]|uniref:Biosynthetic peptidoglycan transglycosylase n=1 Tax=Erwinia pyrifoliae TaxID=79967 RepID=A0ABY5X985_ERWPY|nr:monofunctional biosynthetic peptidoglycan transglycosylase [Erwinia pyrifoliae]UWS29640.1 monofunctional biosynthetic peptidoglycan transglycosylase [Erwinia pyrifoliae]UWS33955.1 monofunctional biosynthetic peptidoglycan transglycosylase [Erwinia pyrifoliae]